MPWLSKRWAYVDFPAPEGPHMKITRLTVGPYVDAARKVLQNTSPHGPKSADFGA